MNKKAVGGHLSVWTNSCGKTRVKWVFEKFIQWLNLRNKIIKIRN